MDKKKLITLMQFVYAEAVWPKKLTDEDAESMLKEFNDIWDYGGFIVKNP
jgi:hypothetical protein